MAIFTTTGAKLYIGPAQSDELDQAGYEAIDTAGHASGEYVFSANPANNATITLNGTAVTFVTTPTGGDVTIGEDLETTLHYLHTFLAASSDTQLVKFTYEVDATTLYLTAVASGSGGNALTTTASSSPASHATPSGATLSGGGSNGWLEVKQLESLGEFGDSASNVTFSDISKGRVTKKKGTKDAGNMSVIVGFDARDPGQIAMQAAEGTSFDYAFKLVAADQRLETDSPSIFYFNALVETSKNNFGTSNNVVKTTFTLAVNTAIITVPSAP